MNPFRTGQLVMFQVSYDRSWHFFEIIFYILIGVFGGLYGAFMMKWNLRAQAFRKKYLSRYAILEATLLAMFTAVICYPNMFLRIDMTESMEILFKECEGDADYDGICEYVKSPYHRTPSDAVLTKMQPKEPVDCCLLTGNRNGPPHLPGSYIIWLQGPGRYLRPLNGHRCLVRPYDRHFSGGTTRIVPRFGFLRRV